MLQTSHKEDRTQTHNCPGEEQAGESEEVQATQLNGTPWECYRLNSPTRPFQAQER